MEMPHRGIGLKSSEIAVAFAASRGNVVGQTSDEGFPAILDVRQVARLLGLRSVKTVYFWISSGRFDGTFRKRGKHLRFWRDRVIERFFNGPQWETANDEQS